LDPNLFGSCSAPEPDLDPNVHDNQDPDPDRKKVGSDPQNWFSMIIVKTLRSGFLVLR